MDDFSTRLVAEMPQLRRYAQALTRDTARAEDLTQTCLLRALVKRDLWQAGTNLRSWLMTMMHNQHISEIRRSRRDDVGNGALALALARHSDPDADHAVLLGEVADAIAGLPDTQQPIVMLAGLQGLDYRHVAARLRIPEGTVRSRLSRARASLRAALDDGGRTGAGNKQRRRAGGKPAAPEAAAQPGPVPAGPPQTGSRPGFAAHPPARNASPRIARHRAAAVG